MFDWLTDAFSFDLDVAPDIDVDTSGYGVDTGGGTGGGADEGYTHSVGDPNTKAAADADYSEYIGKNNGISGGITGVESEAGAAAESPQPYVDSDPEGDLRDARMAQLFDIDIGTSSSGTQQQGDPNTFDKVMATLQKNPRMAAALIQGASGLIAGAGAGYAAKNKQEWEDKKIQEAWERRRLEAKPGTVRKENWGGLIQTAKG